MLHALTAALAHIGRMVGLYSLNHANVLAVMGAEPDGLSVFAHEREIHHKKEDTCVKTVEQL